MISNQSSVFSCWRIRVSQTDHRSLITDYFKIGGSRRSCSPHLSVQSVFKTAPARWSGSTSLKWYPRKDSHPHLRRSKRRALVIELRGLFAFENGQNGWNRTNTAGFRRPHAPVTPRSEFVITLNSESFVGICRAPSAIVPSRTRTSPSTSSWKTLRPIARIAVIRTCFDAASYGIFLLLRNLGG